MTASQDSRFKPYKKMTPEDYAAIGFKSGLEIHQQLLTERKLFCRCPAGLYTEEVDAEILRHMRPTLSELGEYDGTALMEFKTRKEIVYLLKNESVCTYEMDDAPPFEIDPKAIEIAAEIALLLNLNMVSELHIARKQYLDGSIPTGFQRTTIMGVDGSVPFKGRRIGIRQLGLEEDSCREVSDVGHRITFRTDRLGMPLIETVTEPDMRTPQEVAEVAEVLRRMVRATGKVRTGAGAGREDVNVSVEGGTRIEIKGVSSIRRIPHLVYNEAMRQYNLLRIKEELNARGITKETFKCEKAIITNLLDKTPYLPIEHSLERGGVVGAVLLKNYQGILAYPTQEHTYFSQEIADRVKVIACIMDQPNILHSDSTESGISRSQWNRIRKRLNAGNDDTIVLVWGDSQDVNTAMEEIAIRAREATEGVPSETRQAYRDGTNGFERILPGPNRMYPDTDSPPQALSDDVIERLRRSLPEMPWDRQARLQKLGIVDNTACLLAHSPHSVLFDHVYKESACDAKLLANVLVRDMRCFKRQGVPIERLDESALTLIFNALVKGSFHKDALWHVLTAVVKGEARPVNEVIENFKPNGGEKVELDLLIKEAAELQQRLINRAKSSRRNYLMGYIMNKLRGRIAAQTVATRLEEVIQGDGE